MPNYVDGFVLPIPLAKLDQYKAVVKTIAEIWKEHGALAYREYVSDGGFRPLVANPPVP